MKARIYYLNLNYVCNEHCVFCASDLTHNFRISGHKPWVTLEHIRNWVGEKLPGPKDRVMLAGGEPTLHKDLLPIVRFLGSHCPDITLFTNGLRLANPIFAHEVVKAGIRRFEIALFAANAALHDAVTQIPGSFERTLTALETLAVFRQEYRIQIEVRLLVSRLSAPENPQIVRLLHERALGIDSISLNRLILSHNAHQVDAAISWTDARASINLTAQLVRQHGYELRFQAIPLCVFDSDNAAFVQQEIKRKAERVAKRLEPGGWEMLYFDPVIAAGRTMTDTSSTRSAIPDLCLSCDYISMCGRVESWYVRRFGVAGLHPVKLFNATQSAREGGK